MNWKNFHHWFHGLAAAVISSAASTVGAMIGAAAAGHPLDYTQLGGAALGAALLGAALYLKQSPLPPDGAAPPTKED